MLGGDLLAVNGGQKIGSAADPVGAPRLDDCTSLPDYGSGCTRMAAATAPSRVTDRGEVGEQVRRFSWSQQVGVGELGEGGWDRG
jgi:hypothetical protein